MQGRATRWRHSRIASAASQRHTVVPLIMATTPRVTTSRCNSRNDQRASGTPNVRGLSQARRLTSTTTLGGKAAFRPPRGSSSKPARRWSKNRFGHLLTICRWRPRRDAMMSLARPVAARRMIFARTTSRYGDVYFRVLSSRAVRSSRLSVMTNGLRLGTSPGPLRLRA